MAEPFDAYYKWLGIPPAEQPPHLYRLLGLSLYESDPEVIRAAVHRQTAHLRTFQLSEHVDQCQRLLNEVAGAQVCLLDAKKKSAYDRRLRASLAGQPTLATDGEDTRDEDMVDLVPLSEEAAPASLAERGVARTPAAGTALSEPEAETSPGPSAPSRLRRTAAAVLSSIDGRLRAAAGEDPVRHNLLRGLIAGTVLVGPLLVLAVIWAVSTPPPPPPVVRPPAPQPPPPSPARLELRVPAEDYLAAWQYRYTHQRAANPWPGDASGEFHEAITTLGPDAPIPSKYRDLYQSLVDRHFPAMVEIVDLYARQSRDPQTGELRFDPDGRPIKQYPFGRAGRPAGGRGGLAEGFGAGLPGGGHSDTYVGKVDWNEVDLLRIYERFQWDSRPTSVEVRLAQEDLWVYEALLGGIAATNRTAGATSHYSAAVKRIAALEVGRPAAQVFAQRSIGTIIVGLGAPAGVSGTEGAAMDVPVEPAEPEEDTAAGHHMETNPRADRYVDRDGTPVADPDDPAGSTAAPLRRLPFRMVLVMDRRRVSDVLVHLTNSALPLEVTRVSLRPGEGTVVRLDRPRAGGGYGGMAGVRPSATSRGRRKYGGWGGVGVEADRYVGSQDFLDAFDLPVEILGTACLFRPPPAAVAGDPTKAEARELVRDRDACVLWLGLLRALDECLPRDEGAPPEEIILRNELHVANVECEPCDALERWYAAVGQRGWFSAPATGTTGEDASGEALAAEAPETPTGPQGPGYLVALTGYHYHNSEEAGPDQGAEFVRNTLIRNLNTEQFVVGVPHETLPDESSEDDPAEPDVARTVELVTARDLGITCPVLVDPQQVRDHEIVPPYASAEGEGGVPGGEGMGMMMGEGGIEGPMGMGPGMEGLGAGAAGAEDEPERIRLRRFDFVVHFAWQPTPPSDRAWQGDRPPSYARLARQATEPLDRSFYVFQEPFDPPLFHERRKRPAPPLVALTDLRGTGGHGAVHMIPAGGAVRRRAIVGQRWVVLTGLIPKAEQAELMSEAYKDCRIRYPEKDVPIYFRYGLERAEVPSAAYTGELDWSPIMPDRALEITKRFGAGAGREVVPAEFLYQARREIPRSLPLAFPLPPLARGQWGAEAAHTPEIPLESELRARADDVDYSLFRFFDFDVQPGKFYVYRVKLYLLNPNYKVPSPFLESKELAEKWWLDTPWSEPSGAVAVPRDCSVLAGPVVSSRWATVEPEAALGVLYFDIDSGDELFKEFEEVARGQLLNFRDEVMPETAGTGYYTPTFEGSGRLPNQTPESETMDLVTDAVLLDISGGQRLPGRDADATGPGRLLILRPDGQMFVEEELQDKAEYDARKPPEPEKERRRPPDQRGYVPTMEGPPSRALPRRRR